MVQGWVDKGGIDPVFPSSLKGIGVRYVAYYRHDPCIDPAGLAGVDNRLKITPSTRGQYAKLQLPPHIPQLVASDQQEPVCACLSRSRRRQVRICTGRRGNLTVLAYRRNALCCVRVGRIFPGKDTRKAGYGQQDRIIRRNLILLKGYRYLFSCFSGPYCGLSTVRIPDGSRNPIPPPLQA